jgi:hypothetical protein
MTDDHINPLVSLVSEVSGMFICFGRGVDSAIGTSSFRVNYIIIDAVYGNIKVTVK